jgi:predicted small secreted protein
MNFLRCRAFFSRWGGLRPLSIKNHFARTPIMTASTLAKIGAACIVLMTMASCANTIKGVGRDTASAVNATQSAGHTVAKAAQ